MTEVSATETLRMNLVRCDAEVFGEFVDFLFDVVDPEEEGLKGFPGSAPTWKVVTARRRLDASGLWSQVRESIDLTQATLIEVSIWKTQGASMTLQTGRSTAGTLRINASPGWLDRNVPRITSEARALTPRWGKRWTQTPFYVLAVLGLIGWVSSLFGLFSENMAIWAVIGLVSAAISLFSGWALRVPLLQLGPLPAPRWRKPALWVLSAVAAGVIGVLLTRLFDALNPPVQ